MERGQIERWCAAQCLVCAGIVSASVISQLLYHLLDSHGPAEQARATQLLATASKNTVRHFESSVYYMRALFSRTWSIRWWLTNSTTLVGRRGLLRARCYRCFTTRSTRTCAPSCCSWPGRTGALRCSMVLHRPWERLHMERYSIHTDASFADIIYFSSVTDDS